MGADFLYAVTPEAIFDDGKPVANFGDIEKQILNRIIASPEIQTDIAEMMHHKTVEEMQESDWLTSLLVIDWYFQVTVSEPRDCSHIVLSCENGHRSRVHIITGGVSWGDDPTDSFEAIWFLQVTQLFSEPFSYEVLV